MHFPYPYLLQNKQAWPCYPDSNQHSKIDISVDYTIANPEFEKKARVSMLGRALNMRFSCQRKSHAIDRCMEGIYQNTINGRASLLLERNTTQCLSGKVSKHCGNSRNHLFECACHALNRQSHPQLRHQYENEVIAAALRIVQNNPHLSSIHIAIFASGGLHGELVLMIRLINELKKVAFSGKIELFLIDQQYKENIDKAYQFNPSNRSQEFPWVNFLGGREDLAQFLTEISLCLPPTIILSGAIFGDASDYIERASGNAQFCHDLLIGADIENTEAIVSQLKIKAQRTSEPGVMLVKGHNNQPNICKVTPASGRFICTPI